MRQVENENVWYGGEAAKFDRIICGGLIMKTFSSRKSNFPLSSRESTNKFIF